MEILEAFEQLLELKRDLLERLVLFLVYFLPLCWISGDFFCFAKLNTKNYIFYYKKVSRSWAWQDIIYMLTKQARNHKLLMNPILTYSSLALLGCIWMLLEFETLF